MTGLPNRRKLNERLDQSIEQSNRDSSTFAVMVLDIDRFKMINDSLGHTYGDIFLQGVSDRIVKSAEGFETTIARMGEMSLPSSAIPARKARKRQSWRNGSSKR